MDDDNYNDDITKIKPKGEEIIDTVEPINKFVTSEISKRIIISILKNQNFYNLINSIFQISNSNVKQVITKTLKDTTTVNIKTKESKNLSITAYRESVDGIKVVKNSGKGDCFFIAVADAINYYNYYNQKNKIISGRYGTGVNLFTPLYLRNLVYEFLENNPDLDDILINVAPSNAEILNEIFSNSLNGIKQAMIETGQTPDITNEKYIEIAESTYKENDNFLVKSVNSVPIEIENYEKPFVALEKSQIKNYILSNNYWANNIAIFALCEKLKLNIIPISFKINKLKKPNIIIPFANFGNKYNKWKRYLFLYYNNSHFELITFNYKKKEIKFDEEDNPIKIVNIEKKIVIFERSKSIEDLPPIYILFIIYGAFYSNITDIKEKKEFTFQQEIMNIIDIYINTKVKFLPNYIKLFKSYFPNSRINNFDNSIVKSNNNEKISNNSSILPIMDASDYDEVNNNSSIQPFDIDGPEKGGAYNRPYQQYRPNTIPAHKLMKKSENMDSTQLAYYITIDLEVQPGTSITPEEMKNLKCRQKWNSVRKAWAGFTGQPYVIPPVYQTKTLKNKEEKNGGNKTQYKRPLLQNNTQKYKRSGGKKNKTIKLFK